MILSCTLVNIGSSLVMSRTLERLVMLSCTLVSLGLVMVVGCTLVRLGHTLRLGERLVMGCTPGEFRRRLACKMVMLDCTEGWLG